MNVHYLFPGAHEAHSQIRIVDIFLNELIAVLYFRPSAAAPRGSRFRPHLAVAIGTIANSGQGDVT
jgi:hypothetical protein